MPEIDKIKIINANMNELIGQFCSNPSVAFAQCISADFGSERHMTDGVAVLFGKHFGKPSSINCIDSHLTFQKKNKDDAGVFGFDKSRILVQT